jgi:hypothetical protein
MYILKLDPFCKFLGSNDCQMWEITVATGIHQMLPQFFYVYNYSFYNCQFPPEPIGIHHILPNKE